MEARIQSLDDLLEDITAEKENLEEEKEGFE